MNNYEKLTVNTWDNVRKQLKAVNLHPGRVKIVHRQRRVRKREEIQLSENLSNSREIGPCFGNLIIRGWRDNFDNRDNDVNSVFNFVLEEQEKEDISK